MPDDRAAMPTHPATDESLGELLRARALESTPGLLIVQGIASLALNAAVLAWHPKQWGIATAAIATVALHALWSIAVQRTADEPPGSGEVPLTGEDGPPTTVLPTGRSVWPSVRRVASIGATASAMLLLWFVCMMLLGRLMS